MHPLKAKRLTRIANIMREHDVVAAAELETLIATAMTPPHRGPKFPTVASMKDAVGMVANKLGKDFALCGGYAVVHWVDIRKTYDADFVVLGKDFEKLPELFPGGSIKPLIYTVHLAGETVDFLQPKNQPWVEEAIKNAPVADFMGHTMKILSPEYLILYKFQAGRDRDFADIKALLTLPDVPDKARTLIKKYMPQESEDFESLVMEAEYGL